MSSIRLDGDTQVRKAFNTAVIDQYMRDMNDGKVFPEIVVYEDSDGARWLADGWHRLAAAQRLRRKEIMAEVRQGTRRDALLHAVEANLKHGLRMTLADRRHAAIMLLKDDELGCWSSREIGRRCGLDGKTVERLRQKLSAELPQKRKARRGNQVYEQDTTNIGASRAAPKPGCALHADASGLVNETAARELAPRNVYKVIVATPPWDKMSVEDVCRLPVADLASPNCALWLWTDNTHLADAVAALRVWGFEYRSS